MNGEMILAIILVTMVLAFCGAIIYRTWKGHVPRPAQTPYSGFSNIKAYEARAPRPRRPTKKKRSRSKGRRR